MKNDKKRMPTDEGLKKENPKNRNFQRTEEETDKVSESEINERKRKNQKK